MLTSARGEFSYTIDHDRTSFALSRSGPVRRWARVAAMGSITDILWSRLVNRLPVSERQPLER